VTTSFLLPRRTPSMLAHQPLHRASVGRGTLPPPQLLVHMAGPVDAVIGLIGIGDPLRRDSVAPVPAGSGSRSITNRRPISPLRRRAWKARCVIPDQSEDGECSRTLLFPAPDRDTNVTITAKETEKGSAPLCAMADTATAVAIKALSLGRIARRSPPFPADSLARHNACALLAAEALGVVPGVDAGHRDVGFGGWDCTWASTKDIKVNLRFDRNGPLTADDGRHTRLGGYRAFVQPRGDGDDTCVVRVVYRTYIDRNDDETVELLYLVVEGAPSTARLCSMANRLADSAAAALPRA
jgi:hypothetical protein